MNPPSVCVCVPTYQERESLPRTLDGILHAVPDAHVLVIDDNSPDGTGELADRLAAEDPRVHVLHRPGKEGLGPAYIAGFRWALAEGFDVVAQMDADGSHRPEDLPRLLAALSGADAVLGSRWVPGGAVADWPHSRELLSRTANRYVRAVLRLPVGDATGGFRAFRRHTLERLDLDGVQSQGYCFQIDMTRQVWERGLRLVEVPILFVNREFGESKMSSRIIREALVRVTAWSLTSRRPAATSVRPASSGAKRLAHRIAA
ncbi:polyprenol monophosphomannose synthase [Modestobacter sp. VKM Ac-2983]|uniref:polyprenol monophosphomannose synthase n=1 Tax=Modestobacter sp. VKM Ac-2983 TaxID=3004137 RepID=UPI0022AB6780|nr:polyprenol monophosphomannose synthase [Modestobacter sp. VKM Ac-2983]MCZ2805858.1 polyprenol monophosphomannose synthase [Modestobacter sp. VKM Ac-2983]